jgi:hypothetical protein
MTVIAIIAVVLFYTLKTPFIHVRAESIEPNGIADTPTDDEAEGQDDFTGRHLKLRSISSLTVSEVVVEVPSKMSEVIISALKFAVSRRMWLLLP